ncbi:hypothetical protein BES08_15635 [Novosphingobium resinovorum]|uniref:Uncharacterized protein n=1 Tax=Novosphingobium resinovorum TaxID=158500 RepID=A0A1D8A7E0_9SPHN|nr:hypothetical protein BES08_15635 [Novosphingobium resinovorum]
MPLMPHGKRGARPRGLRQAQAERSWRSVLVGERSIENQIVIPAKAGTALVMSQPLGEAGMKLERVC